jgi:putative Ca2+/H+ antiporter (TMEM165/GDT1 family)
MIQEFFSTVVLVAVAEMGDRTQILAIALAARYRKAGSVIAGILVATLLNHLLAAAAGRWLAALASPDVVRWVTGVAFLAFAVWALVPDKAGEDKDDKRWGPFLGTAILFFFVEMGDKTQLATAALAAQYGSVFLVAAGSTLGLLCANVPVVYLGQMFADKLPLKALRYAAAALFLLFGILALAGVSLV